MLGDPGTGGLASGGLSSGGASGGNTSGGTGSSGPRTYSTDRAAFGLGGPSLCAGLGAAFCEDFESAEVGGLPAGFTLEGYGTRTVKIVDDQAARGAKSVEIEIPGGQGAVVAMLQKTDLGELAGGHFGRMMVMIEGPGVPEFIHFDLLEARGPWEGHENGVRYASTGTGVGTGGGNWSWIYNVQPFGGGGPEFGTEGDRSAHPTVDEWMCLEWMFDSEAQEVQYYHDGVAVSYLHVEGEGAEIPVFSALNFGFQKFQNTSAITAHTDEIALDHERIGCNN